MAGVSKWKNMNIENIHDISEPNEEAWEYSEEVTNDAGHAIIIPAGCNNIGVTVKYGTGSYTVQATTNLLYKVKNDMANCTWIDWDTGSALTADAQDTCNSAVTAIRLESLGGTSEIFVNAK